MANVTFVLLGVAALVALSDWRYGLHAVLVAAILQDIARKLIPGQPAYFVLVAGAVFGLACIAAVVAGVPTNPNRLFGWKRYLAKPLTAFILLLVFQSAQAMIRFGNPMIPAIGLITYVAPLPAILFGYQFAARLGPRRLNQFFVFYVACATLALGTVYLEFIGFKWPILGEVGIGIRIYDVGTVLAANSGVFRSSEVAAWHTATCVCFLLLLITYRRSSTLTIVFAVLTIAFLLGVGAVTGRRKLFIEAAVFSTVYLGLLVYFRRGATKLAWAIFLVGVVILGGIYYGVSPDTSDIRQQTQYDLYVQRSQTVFGDVPERFQELGLGPIVWAYNRAGLLGLGLGAAAQGSQYVGDTGGLAGGAGEGGLGKIMVELGAPGLLIAVWLAVALFRVIWIAMRYTAQTSATMARLSFGLFGFLLANVAAFAVASQVYGDVFILLLIGLTVGFLLATPVIARRQAEMQRAPQREAYRQPPAYAGPMRPNWSGPRP